MERAPVYGDTDEKSTRCVGTVGIEFSEITGLFDSN